MTPAMAAGVTKRLWEMKDFVNMIEAWERLGLAVFGTFETCRLALNMSGGRGRPAGGQNGAIVPDIVEPMPPRL